MSNAIQVGHQLPILQRNPAGRYSRRGPYGEPRGVPTDPSPRIWDRHLLSDLLCWCGYDRRSAQWPQTFTASGSYVKIRVDIICLYCIFYVPYTKFLSHIISRFLVDFSRTLKIKGFPQDVYGIVQDLQNLFPLNVLAQPIQQNICPLKILCYMVFGSFTVGGRETMPESIRYWVCLCSVKSPLSVGMPCNITVQQLWYEVNLDSH